MSSIWVHKRFPKARCANQSPHLFASVIVRQTHQQWVSCSKPVIIWRDTTSIKQLFAKPPLPKELQQYTTLLWCSWGSTSLARPGCFNIFTDIAILCWGGVLKLLSFCLYLCRLFSFNLRRPSCKASVDSQPSHAEEKNCGQKRRLDLKCKVEQSGAKLLSLYHKS